MQKAADHAALRTKLMAELEEAARAGKVCPFGEELGKAIGCSEAMITKIMAQLKAAGDIAVQVRYFGTGVGKVRIVRLVRLGLTTATPQMGQRPAASASSTELDAAKTALKRAGARSVFAASVNGGPAGHTYVDGDLLADADVIERAKALVSR